MTLYKRDHSWQTVSKQHESALFSHSGDPNGVWSQLPSCGASLTKWCARRTRWAERVRYGESCMET